MISIFLVRVYWDLGELHMQSKFGSDFLKLA
jgi:hypothetical protein